MARLLPIASTFTKCSRNLKAWIVLSVVVHAALFQLVPAPQDAHCKSVDYRLPVEILKESEITTAQIVTDPSRQNVMPNPVQTVHFRIPAAYRLPTRAQVPSSPVVQADNDVAQDQLLLDTTSSANTTNGRVNTEMKPVDHVTQNVEPKRRPSPLAGSLSREQYLSNLRATIEQHRGYPLAARRRHLEGTAVLRFSVSRNGQLFSMQLVRSSGEGLLDTAAMNAVRAVESFPVAPADVLGEQFTLELPVVFRLTKGTASL